MLKKMNHMEIIKLKCTLSKIKKYNNWKLLDGISISLNMTEEKIRKLEEKSTKITKQKGKKLKQNKTNPTRASEGEERINGAKNI